MWAVLGCVVVVVVAVIINECGMRRSCCPGLSQHVRPGPPAGLGVFQGWTLLSERSKKNTTMEKKKKDQGKKPQSRRLMV